MEGKSEILDVRGIAKLLSISTRKVYRLTRTGAIPSKRIGNEYRYVVKDVLAATEFDSTSAAQKTAA